MATGLGISEYFYISDKIQWEEKFDWSIGFSTNLSWPASYYKKFDSGLFN